MDQLKYSGHMHISGMCTNVVIHIINIHTSLPTNNMTDVSQVTSNTVYGISDTVHGKHTRVSVYYVIVGIRSLIHSLHFGHVRTYVQMYIHNIHIGRKIDLNPIIKKMEFNRTWECRHWTICTKGISCQFLSDFTSESVNKT